MLTQIKWYWYAMAALVIIGIGKHFYDKQELRIITKQFEQERDVWQQEREQLINLKYIAIDSTIAAQKPIYIKIKDLQKKGQTLETQSQQIKLKRDEIDNFINNASEPVLDSVLRAK